MYTKVENNCYTESTFYMTQAVVAVAILRMNGDTGDLYYRLCVLIIYRKQCTHTLLAFWYGIEKALYYKNTGFTFSPSLLLHCLESVTRRLV